MSVLLIWTKLVLHSSVVSTLKLAALMYTKLGSDSLSISAFWVGPFLLAANRIGYWYCVTILVNLSLAHIQVVNRDHCPNQKIMMMFVARRPINRILTG